MTSALLASQADLPAGADDEPAEAELVEAAPFEGAFEDGGEDAARGEVEQLPEDRQVELRDGLEIDLKKWWEGSTTVEELWRSFDQLTERPALELCEQLRLVRACLNPWQPQLVATVWCTNSAPPG